MIILIVDFLELKEVSLCFFSDFYSDLNLNFAYMDVYLQHTLLH